MFHFFDALLNRAGAALPGHFARVINTGTQAVVPIFSDNAGTPIISVSGVANMAKSDDDGNLSLFVDSGTYHLDIYGPDATTFIRRVSDVGMSLGGEGPPGPPGPAFATWTGLAAFKAAPISNKTQVLASPAANPGTFTWETANAPYTADDVNIVKADSTALSVGAWVRQSSKGLTFRQAGTGAVARDAQAKAREAVSVLDFGAIADGVTNCSPAFAAAQIAVGPGGKIKIPRSALPYVLYDTIDPAPYIVWEGDRATIAAGSDNMVLFETGFASYFCQFRGLTFSGKNKTGITGFHVSRFNATAGLFDCSFADMDRAIVLDQACFGGTLFNMFTERVPRPVKILQDGSAFNIINANFDNGETVYLPGQGAGIKGTGVGIEIVAAGVATIGCTITGYFQGFDYGILDGGTKTRVSAYFEANQIADIFGSGAQHSAYRDCHFLASVGQSGVKLRNTDGVLIDHPIMSSGGRSIGLYDIDNSNTNPVELRPNDASSRNNPLGNTSGLARLITEIGGSFIPTVFGSTSAGAATYSVQSAIYKRIGERAVVSVTVAWTGHTGTGALLLTGLPAAVTPGSFTIPRLGQVFVTAAAVAGVDRAVKFQGVGGNLTVSIVAADGSESLMPIPSAGKLEVNFAYDL